MRSIDKEIRELAHAVAVKPKQIGMAHVELEERVRNALATVYAIGAARGRKQGLNAAADALDEWNEAELRASRYRIADRLRCKFNLWRRAKPRLFRRGSTRHV